MSRAPLFPSSIQRRASTDLSIYYTAPDFPKETLVACTVKPLPYLRKIEFICTFRARDRDYRCPGHLRGPRVNAQRHVRRGCRLKGTRVYHVEQETEGKLMNSDVGTVAALVPTPSHSEQAFEKTVSKRKILILSGKVLEERICY